jgi:hypothetical protein
MPLALPSRCRLHTPCKRHFPLPLCTCPWGTPCIAHRLHQCSQVCRCSRFARHFPLVRRCCLDSWSKMSQQNYQRRCWGDSVCTRRLLPCLCMCLLSKRCTCRRSGRRIPHCRSTALALCCHLPTGYFPDNLCIAPPPSPRCLDHISKFHN